jgi:hypothetical protein
VAVDEFVNSESLRFRNKLQGSSKTDALGLRPAESRVVGLIGLQQAKET